MPEIRNTLSPPYDFPGDSLLVEYVQKDLCDNTISNALKTANQIGYPPLKNLALHMCANKAIETNQYTKALSIAGRISYLPTRHRIIEKVLCVAEASINNVVSAIPNQSIQTLIKRDIKSLGTEPCF